LKRLPDAAMEKQLLQECQRIEHRFRVTKAETLAMAFLYGGSANRPDRDAQIDAILCELSGRNIPVEHYMAPR